MSSLFRRSGRPRARLARLAVDATVASVVSVCLLADARAHGFDPLRPPSADGNRERRVVAALIARRLPVYCAGGRRPDVALSFDDGPTLDTRELVGMLRTLRTPATFFEVGENGARYPALARLESAVGPVGDHTQTHAILTRESRARAWWEIAEGRRSVERVLRRPIDLFRPPGDHHNGVVDAMVADQGMLSTLYAVDPRDWALRSASAVARAVDSDPRLVAGAIILLHENHPTTVEALPVIVHTLRARGFRLVTVPRLLADDPPTVGQQEADQRVGSCAHLYRR